MMHYIEIVTKTLVATLVGICGKRIYHKITKWYYNEKTVKIDDVNIEFIPQTTEEETIIVNEKNKNPKVFKFYSSVE